MAVFEKIECNITIDGENVPEYDCPPDHDASVAGDESITGPLVEKYIESKSDQNFAIKIVYPKGFSFKEHNAVTAHIYIDGTQVESSLKRKKCTNRGALSDTILTGVRMNHKAGASLHKFRFNNVTTEESGRSGSRMDHKQLARLGDIVVRIFRATCKGRAKVVAYKGREEASSPTVSEKQIKGRAIDAFTSLDMPTKIKKVKSRPTTLDAKPLVEFVYHYRGREVLQQLSILEIPLNERPLEARDPSSLSLDEMRELLRRKEDVIRQQEDTEKLMKKRLREADARRNLLTLESIKRARSPSLRPASGDNEDDEVQIVKKAKRDRMIEIVELD